MKIIYKRKVYPRNNAELWKSIKTVRKNCNLNEKICRNLVHSMPRRLGELIEKNGAGIVY